MGAKANKYRAAAEMDTAPVTVRDPSVGATPVLANAEELDVDMQGCDTLLVFVRAALNAASAVTEALFRAQLTGKDPTNQYEFLGEDPQVPAGGIQAVDMVQRRYTVPLAASPAVNYLAFELEIVAPAVRLLFWSDVAGHADDDVEVLIQRVQKRPASDN